MKRWSYLSASKLWRASETIKLREEIEGIMLNDTTVCALILIRKV